LNVYYLIDDLATASGTCRQRFQLFEKTVFIIVVHFEMMENQINFDK